MLPNQFRSIDDGFTGQHDVIDGGERTGCNRIGGIRRRCDPATFIVTNAILTGVAGKTSTKTGAFYIKETIRGGEFLTQDKVLRILLADGCEIGIPLHHGDGIQTGSIIRTTKAGDQIAAVLLVQFHQIREMCKSLWIRYRPRVIKTPKLFRIIETQYIGIFSVELFVYGQIKIRKVTETTTGRLHQHPHLIFGTGPYPGFCRFITVLHCFVGSSRCVVVDGKRYVHHHIRTNIGWDQVDDLLWVGIVPRIDVYDEHGLIRRNGSSQGRICLCVQ